MVYFNEEFNHTLLYIEYGAVFHAKLQILALKEKKVITSHRLGGPRDGKKTSTKLN